jgi:hypothetical protein
MAKINNSLGTTYTVIGANTFLELTDTENSYVGQANKKVIVNNDETALIFVENNESSVTSVNGQTGDVILDYNDVGAQQELGYTPENVANKENITLDISESKYPTNKLVKEYIDTSLSTKQDSLGYTPENVANKTTNIDDGVDTYLNTPTVKNALNLKQDVLGYTPENVVNKENIILDNSTTKYPTNNLVKTYVDANNLVGFVTINSSRSLTNTDYNKTLIIDANVTLTIPNTGLIDNFICFVDVLNTFTLTWATGAGVVLTGNNSTTQTENTMSMLYKLEIGRAHV